MTTLGCHLCELAEEVLIAGVDPARFYVEAQDIAEDDALIEAYGVRIPVLVDEVSGTELGWPFDVSQLQTFLHNLPQQPA